MARSAGHRYPVGLARRSRRVLAAAVAAAAALAVPVAISGADGPKGPPPKVEVVKSPADLARKQAEIDQQLQHVQEVAARKQATIDQQAQHLADDTADRQAQIGRHAQKLQLPAPAAAPAPTAAPAAATTSAPAATPAPSSPVIPTATSAPAPSRSSTQAAATTQPAAGSTAPQVTAAPRPARPAPASVPPRSVRKFARHETYVQPESDAVERSVTTDDAEAVRQGTNLATQVSRRQSELDRRRAEVAAWLARRLADLVNRRLALDLQVQTATRIPPAVWKPAAPPPVKVIQTGNQTTVIAPGVPVAPVQASVPSTASPARPAPGATRRPASAAPSPGGVVPTTRSAPVAGVAPVVAAGPAIAGLTSAAANGPGAAGRGKHRSPRHLGNAVPRLLPARRRAPVAVVLHPLARAVAEIPRTVWIGMGGLGAIALALALVSVLQSRRALALVAAQRSLKADVDTLSSAVTPAVPAAIGGLALTVAFRPANGPASGGDFHDAFELTDGRGAVIVGDVAGHGRETVAATVLVRHTLRAYLEAGLEPRAALATAGAVLADRHEGLLATAVVAVHDSYRSTLTLASAGHVPPVVLGGVGHRPVAVAWPPPLGAGVPTGRRQTTLPLANGMTVCLFTDGATEARMGDGRVGPAELETWLRELGPDATAEEVLDHLQQHADDIDDDVTICVLHSTDPDAVGPPELIEELAVIPGEGPTLIRFLIACGITPARAAELAVSLEEAPERATMVAEVRIGERTAQARLRPARPALPSFAA